MSESDLAISHMQTKPVAVMAMFHDKEGSPAAVKER
jgi:hypothetical protein